MTGLCVYCCGADETSMGAELWTREMEFTHSRIRSTRGGSRDCYLNSCYGSWSVVRSPVPLQAHFQSTNFPLAQNGGFPTGGPSARKGGLRALHF